MRTFVIILSCLAIGVLTAIGQMANDKSYLEYSLPQKDFDKYGPITTPDERVFYTYYFKGASIHDDKAVLGREYFFKETRVKLELFKNGKKHGVQKEWYKDGKPKLESPYKDGVRYGVFRVWNEKGELVGECEIKNGEGVMQIYHSNGRLYQEKHFSQNAENSLALELYDNGQAASLNWYKQGHFFGNSFAFEKDGELQSWGNFNSEGRLHGPSVYFEPNINPKQITFYVNGVEADESHYLEEAKKDSNLPPFYKDLTEYKKMLTPEIQQIVEKYKNLPRVKIPLELGANGNILLAN